MPKKNATLAPKEVLTPWVVEDATCSSGKCGGCTGFRIWTAVFIVVLAQLVSTAFFSDLITKNTVTKLQEFEYSQRGGKETFDLLNKAQVLQLKGQIDQIKAYVENAEKTGGSKTESPTGESATETKTMPQEEIEAIKKSSYFQGKEGSRIIAVEYTDPECPYCIRQSKDKILSQLLEKYDGKIQTSHKVFRAVPHPGAEPKSIALLCVAQQGGATAYSKYFDTIMERSTQEKVMPVDEILPLAKEQGLDVKKFSSCFDGKETISQYDANTKEGNKYGVQGTPGTLIIDTETGKYQLISGAYPIESFTAAVDALLK